MGGSPLILLALALSFDQVRDSHRLSDARLLDRRGRVIHERRLDPKIRRLDWTPLEKISPALVSAVVEAEDRRFYSHGGVDWRAVVREGFRAASFRRPRGASTITMQAAGLLSGQRGPRDWRQKLRQMAAARRLEASWSKEQIIEAYLNLASFRGELQGIAAASRGLFDKEPHGLNASESRILAALLRSPQARPEELRLSGEDQTLALAALSRPPRVRPLAAAAPHAARLLLSEGPAEVASTLDAGLQEFASGLLAATIRGLHSQNATDGAVLVADNRTGQVLAYVGNSGAGSAAPHVDGVRARRQAGSTLKPFLYALAFERKLITPASKLDDSPLEIHAGRGLFRPQDYDGTFRGAVPAKVALASSINIPAVRVLALAGEEPFLEKLEASGISDLGTAEFYGPSLALGTADVTLWELVNAYRTLANGGLRAELSLTASAPARQTRVFTPQAAFLVSDILSDRESRAATFGLDSPLATRFWTAVKTGTSKDMRDNWCVGYSDRYTVGVWMGNFSGAPMWNVSGVSGAAPVWRSLMAQLHRDRPSLPPRPPAGLVRRGSDWFLAGTEPGPQEFLPARPIPKILSPVSGTIFAIDPDIPEGRQTIEFQSSGGGSRWRLNGAEVESPWEPRLGRHELALVDSLGRELDRSSFEVR